MRAAEWLLLAACAVLLVAGPAMALQEWARHQQAVGIEAVTGETAPLEPAFRASWRGILLLTVIVSGVAGTLVALRVARQPRVRAVSGRLLVLLLAGMTLLDLAFLADGRWFAHASYGVRGATVVWLYPLAGILMAGSALRLDQLQEAFAEPRAKVAAPTARE